MNHELLTAFAHLGAPDFYANITCSLFKREMQQNVLSATVLAEIT